MQVVDLNTGNGAVTLDEAKKGSRAERAYGTQRKHFGAIMAQRVARLTPDEVPGIVAKAVEMGLVREMKSIAARAGRLDILLLLP